MGRDALSTRIEANDKKLAGTPINAEESSIFKVHELLLKMNEKAYKPMLLAIGPYNDHGKDGHGFMEEHKLRYLKQMLQRRNERSVKDYISALSDLEERARNCYAERISLKKDEFVEMMLLDGCFIIEFFRKHLMPHLRDKHDPIFQTCWMLAIIACDLILFENQLPYFVLTKLFEMSARDQTPLPSPSIHPREHTINFEQNNEITCLESSTSIYHSSVQTIRLSDFAIDFLIGSLSTFQDWDFIGTYSTEKIKHLLCQTDIAITPPLANMVHEHLKVGAKFKKADFKHLLDLMHTIIKLSILEMELHYATESQEVGVKFKKGEIFKHLFGLIHGVVSALLAKLENMKKGDKKKSIFYAKERPDDLERIKDWKSIPYGNELHDAGVKFEDKFKENESWKSIKDGIAFQEAGIEFEKAKKFQDSQKRPNEDGKSKLCGIKFEMIKKFIRLPFLNKIEKWNSIPQGTKFKKAEIEFKKAKKYTDTKNMIEPRPNATELKEGGVKFMKAKQRTTFTKFSNGVLEISPLRIDGLTETYLRNLVAFEQYSSYNDSRYVSNYVCFMDDLIDSSKDVEILRRKGIIENWLGDDEVASTMVNKLAYYVEFSPSNCLYAKTSIDMNKHCAKHWNEWMANLRHNYFNSPWALLSVLAAILLLGLAITQTVFSIIN